MFCFRPFFARRSAAGAAAAVPVRWHTLAAGALMRLHGDRRLRVVCVRGVVWLTAADDARDVILRAGDAITRAGRQQVLQALADSVVEISLDAVAERAVPTPQDRHHV